MVFGVDALVRVLASHSVRGPVVVLESGPRGRSCSVDADALLRRRVGRSLLEFPGPIVVAGEPVTPIPRTQVRFPPGVSDGRLGLEDEAGTEATVSEVAQPHGQVAGR